MKKIFFRGYRSSIRGRKYFRPGAQRYKLKASIRRPRTDQVSGQGFRALLQDSRIIIAGSVILIVVLVAVFGPTLLQMTRPQPPSEAVNNVAEETTAEETEEAKEPEILDLSQGAQVIESEETYINQPSVYGREVIYSAGSGSIDEPVLKTLYIYNLDTKKEEKLAEAKVKFGEIYEPLLNESWIIWLDTDQLGTNIIMGRDRKTGKDVQIKECKNGKPKLRLYGNTLIWMEQTGEKEDKLYMYDLVSGENIPLATFHDEATYGVSAPSIYGDQIVWAGPDPDQSEEEKSINEKSTINIMDLNKLSEDAPPEVYKPDTYVHEPVTNGKVFAWLDGNKSPDARLLLTTDRQNVKEVAQGVTGYCLGDNFIVYGKDQAIWIYFWEKDQYGKLTAAHEKGMLPCVQGKTVVWYDLTDEEETKDILKYKVIE